MFEYFYFIFLEAKTDGVVGVWDYLSFHHSGPNIPKTARGNQSHCDMKYTK
jgi:hypothetical protein